MRFSTKAILISLGAALLANFVRADDCSEGPVDSLKSWGKAGASNGFCHTPWKRGLVVTGIEVWANEWQVKGIQLTFSDGSKPPLQGTADGDRHNSINWGPDDVVTNMKLAGNYAGDGLGLVHVEVAGKTLDVRSDTGSYNGEDVTIASGLFLGASGEAGDFVHMWTPLFMGVNTGSATIVDVKFDDNLDDINKRQQGIKPMAVQDIYIQNTNPEGGQNQTWSFSGKASVTWSSSMSTTTQHTFGLSEAIELGGKFGLPFVAQGEVKSTTTISYQYQSATTKDQGFSEGRDVTWTQGSSQTSDLITPGHAKHCVATSYRAEYDGGYTSTIKVTVGGKDFFITRHGQYNSVSWTGAWSRCDDVLVTDIPSDGIIKNAPDTTGDTGTGTKRAMKFIA